MNPIFFNSSSNNYSPHPNDLHDGDQSLSTTSQAFPPSNPLTTHMFLNSNIRNQHEVFDTELQPPQHQHEGDNLGSQVYNDHRIENNNDKIEEFPTWNKCVINNLNNDQNQMKWMSSKMRVMLKMKKTDSMNVKILSSSTRDVTKLEDHKPPMEETDNSSNSSSSNNHIPVRVCSDCNTTKTPLWRSGPCGPKSLCNACGIRQRKARRALAAAEANGTRNVFTNHRIVAPFKASKTQPKDHKKPKIGHVTKYKKRQFTKQKSTTMTTTPTITPSSPSPSPSASPSPSPSPPSSSPARKNCVEDFLVNLSKNLTCYRVFPEDEKEAAILLMALSCGYAHET